MMMKVKQVFIFLGIKNAYDLFEAPENGEWGSDDLTLYTNGLFGGLESSEFGDVSSEF